jgi:hypothetical protein
VRDLHREATQGVLDLAQHLRCVRAALEIETLCESPPECRGGDLRGDGAAVDATREVVHDAEQISVMCRGHAAVIRGGMRRSLLLAMLLTVLPVGACASTPPRPAIDVIVFDDESVHFAPDAEEPAHLPKRHANAVPEHADNGRELSTRVVLPAPDPRRRILARVATRPVPKDELHVHDPWDRAGHVRLEKPGMPPVEIVKFVTAYGGVTEHEVDVTHLASLLTGECRITMFIDTWSAPGWRVDFSLAFEDDPSADPPDWAVPVFFAQEVTAENPSAGGDVDVPAGLSRVHLHYMVSGHCTDGRGADEFETRDNFLVIDGIVSATCQPWRDDCRQFRDRNPYCRRWSDGSWSSDYSRTGWCPSDVVAPLVFDVTRRLPEGAHRVDLHIRDIRPQDDSGHGYWRTSAYLVGWQD